MAFIIMVALVGVSAWITWIQCKQQIARCYENKLTETHIDEENVETTEMTELETKALEIKERPTDRKLLVYLILSTVLNIGLMALSYYMYQDKVIYAFKLAMVFQWIVAIAFIDYHTFTIPNKMIVLGIGMAFVFALVEIFIVSYPVAITLKDYFFGFLLGALVFLISGFIVKGSVGMGDVKLFATLGLLLGCVGVFNLLFFTVLVSAISGIVILLCKRGNKRTLLPLAPFTYVGMVLVLAMGI